MDFDPSFSLLRKFSIDLETAPKNENDVFVVSKYLGFDLPTANLEDRIKMLSKELSRQNEFLTVELEHDSIIQSNDYRRSMFIREVVANNRSNRRKRENSGV